MQMEPAMAQMLTIMQNNVKSSLGMYKASVGQGEGDQSGRAILALKKESDTGTLHFGENQGISIMHGGRIIVDLIPKIYDTKRILRIMGEDGKVSNVQIDPAQEQAVREVRDAAGKIQRIYNLGVGKYDVTVTVGPGYTTSRQEASTVMTELANSAKDPVSAAIMRYAAVKNSDFHGSEEVTKMLKAMLPPQLQEPDINGQEIPPEAMAKIGQLQQAGQQLQLQLQEMGKENQQLKAGSADSQAKTAADHDAKMNQVALERVVQEEKARLARDTFEFNKKLEIDKANHAIDLEERKAFAANKQQADKLAFERQCKVDDTAAKAAEKQAAQTEKDETSALPEVIKTLKEIVVAVKQPQVVTLGNVKYKDGKLIGAEATRTVN
jgi:hypothetical protein